MAERELKVKFTGDTKGLERSLSRSEKALKTTGDHISRAGKALAAGAAAGVAAGVAFATSSVNTYKSVGGEILKLQRFTGQTAEDASRLRAAFKLTGIDTDKAARSFGIFSKNIAAGKIDKLGVDLKDAHGKMVPFSEALGRIADKIAGMPPGTERTALAIQAFGKSGTDLLPFLSKGSAGIAALGKESDKLGTTLSGKDLDAIKESKKQSRLWGLALDGLKITMGRELLPKLTDLVTWLNEKGIPALKKFGDKVHDWLVPKLAELAEWWDKKGKKSWDDFVKWVQETLLPLLEKMGKDIIEKVVKALDKMVKWGKDNPDWAQPIVLGFAAIIVMIKLTSIAFLTSPWGAALTLLIIIGVELYNLYKTNQGFAEKVDRHIWEIKEGWKQLAGWLEPVGRVIKQKWDDLARGIQTNSVQITELIRWVGGVYTWLKGPVGDAASWISSQWTRMVGDAQRGAGQISGFLHWLGGVYNWIKGAIGSVAGWIAGQWDRMVRDAQRGYAQINGIIHALGTAYGYLANPVEAIASFMARQWDRMVRDAQEGARKVKAALDSIQSLGGWLQSHNPLAINIPGLMPNMAPPPALMAGGVVPGTPHGTLVLAGEHNRPEVVSPIPQWLNRGGSGGNRNYQINVTVAAGGDTVRAGRDIVSAIKAWERVAGPSWRAS